MISLQEATNGTQVIDPLRLQQLLWPNIHFYDKQREIIYSTINNDETIVPAGNMLGKDFVSGFIALYFFLSRHPCRIITTSVKDDHLRVLWGEIGRLIDTSTLSLRKQDGGNLVCNHQEIKKIVNGELCKVSYLLGMVAGDGAAMQGHHCTATVGSPEEKWWKAAGCPPLTLFLCDEASGVQDEYYKMASTWAKRMLIIGNPWPCSNFFYRGVKGDPRTNDRGGDVARDVGSGFYRRVIEIGGDDSPNVRYGHYEQRLGLEPSNKIVCPGVLTFFEYLKRRKLWDKIRQTVSIDGKFYEGAENLMFPPDWLSLANQWARLHRLWPRELPRAMGVDPAEGGDSSCWSMGNQLGLYKQISLKTPDTTVVWKKTLQFIKEFDIPAENVYFDAGGGGKWAADTLRDKGYKVRTVAFGEAASDVDRFKRYRSKTAKVDEYEDKQTYKNRRAEMYWIARQLIDPTQGGFGIPDEYTELRRQLAPLPILFDGEGKYRMLPKNRTNKDSKEMTLTELLGCSPDEADSFVLMCFGLTEATAPRPKIGAVNIGEIE